MMLCAMSVAMMAVSLTACNNASPKMDEQPSNESAATSNGGTRIAYVEVDSLMSQYKFCKDYSLILQKKSNNARNTLSQKGAQLQAAAANFQQKMNNNGFASREQAAAVQSQQQDLQELQQRLESELASETNKYNAALRDSLQHFLKVYNKDKKYDLILSKAGDNILYASKKNDITQDVVNGLNKNYKPTGKLAQETAKK